MVDSHCASATDRVTSAPYFLPFDGQLFAALFRLAGDARWNAYPQLLPQVLAIRLAGLQSSLQLCSLMLQPHHHLVSAAGLCSKVLSPAGQSEVLIMWWYH